LVVPRDSKLDPVEDPRRAPGSDGAEVSETVPRSCGPAPTGVSEVAVTSCRPRP